MLISLSLRLQSAGTQPNVRRFFLLPARVQQSHLHTQLKCTSHCFRCHVYEAIPGFGYGRTQTNSMYINCCPQSQETSRGSARRRGVDAAAGVDRREDVQWNVCRWVIVLRVLSVLTPGLQRAQRSTQRVKHRSKEKLDIWGGNWFLAENQVNRSNSSFKILNDF